MCSFYCTFYGELTVLIIGKSRELVYDEQIQILQKTQRGKERWRMEYGDSREKVSDMLMLMMIHSNVGGGEVRKG